MRKRISQFINCRHRWSMYLSVIFLFALGIVSDIQAQSSEIGIEFQVRDQPVNPSELDEICFDFTATNLTDDTLTNVVIIQNGVVIGGPSVSNFGLLPNGVTLPGANTATGSGTFVLTGSTCSLPTGMMTPISAADIANGFVVGAEVCASGTVGAPSSTMLVAATTQMSCVAPIACFGVTLTCTDYNVSLDASCETLLTPELLSLNTRVPSDQLRIRIQEADGSFRPTAMVDDNDVGKAVKVMVDIPGCSNVAPCWSFANIEYKLGPAQFCTTDTVSCAQQIADNLPVVTFSCGATEFIRGQVIREDLCRVSDEFLAKETTTFAVRDQFGNISDTCTQVRYITKPNFHIPENFEEITFPDTVLELSCEAAIFDENGAVDVMFSGTPVWDGVSLFDSRDVPQLCNVFADFEDIQDLDVGCMRTIIRRWTITEWRCEGGAFRRNMLQRIILRDTTPPVITLPVTQVELGVNESGCTASFMVPEAIVADNCQAGDRIEVEVRYPGGSSLTRNETDRGISVPLGEGNIIEYIARDLCGNTSRDTIIVNVFDRTAPVAVCLRETVISITGTEVNMTIDKFDQDSYDSCELDRSCVVRMEDQTLFNSLNPNSRGEVLFDVFDLALAERAGSGMGCYRDYSANSFVRDGKTYLTADGLCTDRVRFCCADAGKDIPVILRAYDMAGNTNECMVMVGVQDKSDPVITCLTEEIVVSCDFDFDPNADLDGVFGTIRNGLTVQPIEVPAEFLVSSSGPLVNGTYVDNCDLGRVIEERVVDRDSICRTGEIIRRFSVVIGNDTTQVCEQLITIVGDQNNNPLEWDEFPGTVRIEAMSPTDVEDLAKENPPTVLNVGCSQIGLGYRDQAFHVDSGVYCTKIVRTWEVIDWCRNPTGLVELDSIQFILVSDNDAPEVTLNTSVTVPQPSAGNAIELSATATDNVIDNPRFLNWSIEVFRGSQTTPFIVDTLGRDDFRNSSAIVRLEGLATGDYTIVWTVSDQCMNEVEVEQSLTVVDSREDDASNLVGQVFFSRGGAMDQVEVFLTQEVGIYTDAAMSITDTEGSYAFENMPLGGEYFIDPEKNDDPLNGVTTLDLILIQRHILGLTVLDDPALLIAADVNNDFRVTSLDLVELRRLLLGYTENFTNKDSWTFVHDQQAIEYGFPLEDEYRVSELAGDMSVSFTGIKTGDISGDAIGHSTGIASGRSLSVNTWSYNRVEYQSGMIGIEVVANEDVELTGFQTNWNWNNDGLTFKSIVSGRLDVTSDHYNASVIEEGRLPMSYYNGEVIKVNASDVLFTMIFKEEGLSNQESISLSSERLNSEIYSLEGVAALQLENNTRAVLAELSLEQNTPNPWSETTIIKANMPESGQASFRVYDLHNRLIHQEARKVEKGIQAFSINQEDVPQSGLFFYEIELNGQVARQKMIKVN